MEAARRESLRVRGVSAGYGARQVLRGLSLELPRAALTVVLGPGGSGKSTLLHALARLSRERTDARSDEEPWAIGELPPIASHRFAQPLQRLDCAALDADALALAERRVATRLARAPELLTANECAALLGSPAALLRCDEILASAAELLLLDEPDADLDPLAARALGRLVRARAHAGATVVLVTHDLSLVYELADHALLLLDGIKLDEGPLARLLAAPASERVRSFFTWGT